MNDDEFDFVDEVPATVMDKAGVVKKVESQRPHHELEGFAVNMLPAGTSGGFVESVVDWFDERYDEDRFEHDEPVGVVLVDAEDPDRIFPVGMWDTVAFRTDSVAPDVGNDGEVVQGGVAVVGRSGTLRVRGVGAVDVEPFDVVEVTKRYTEE